MKRELQPRLETLLRAVDDTRVVVIEGARQVGKSFLVSQALTEVGGRSVSLDLEKQPLVRKAVTETADFGDFRALMKDRHGVTDGTILFIDEAQEAPVLASYVKSFKEDWPQVKVILTGSSMRRLFSADGRVPVGRIQSLCVGPFTFAEFCRYTQGDELADFLASAPTEIPPSRHQLLLELYDSYLQAGGYPEAVKAFSRGEPARSVVEEILAQLEEDFLRKEDYQPGLFDATLRAVADHVGMPSSLSHVNATRYHAARIIESLKYWHLILEVQQRSLDPRASHPHPKRYLHDAGVVSFLRSIPAPTISLVRSTAPALRTPLGGLFENALLINLLEGESAFKRVDTWKKTPGADIEVDFVADMPEINARLPVECKASLSVNTRHYKNIIHYLNTTNQRLGILCSAAPMQKIETPDGKIILNLPVYLCTKGNIVAYSRDLQ